MHTFSILAREGMGRKVEGSPFLFGRHGERVMFWGQGDGNTRDFGLADFLQDNGSI